MMKTYYGHRDETMFELVKFGSSKDVDGGVDSVDTSREQMNI